MSYKKYGGSVQCRRHATLSAVGGVLQGFTPVKKKFGYCRRLVSIQRPPRYERITDPLSDHCWSKMAKVGVLGALPLSYTGRCVLLLLRQRGSFCKTAN